MSTFPFGGGKMGQAIREFDWKTSTLGLPEDWCESLRANLNLLLNSPFAMCMAWGPSLLFFYNDAYSEVLGKRHGSSLGRPMAEVWWDIWDDIKPWIDEALAGGTIQREDTHLVMQRNGYAEDTYWTFAYSPLADTEGKIQGFIDVCIETTAKILNERKVAEEQHRLRQLFDTAPAFMALLLGPDHRIEMTNSGYQSLIGHRDVLGKTVKETLDDAVAQGYLDILDNVYRTGETYFGKNAKYAVQAVPGGPVAEHYVDFVYQAMKDANGKTYGIFVNGIDVTERKKADVIRDVLHREMVHRVKNIMSIVSAVVSASMRNATTMEEARETIASRIHSLGRTQDLLTNVHGNTDLENLVREAMMPHLDSSERLVIDGPAVTLSPQQAVGLSLAIYELATNATKYGALSVPGGQVSITWTGDSSGAFDFRWREHGGPIVALPTRSGFGSRLTGRIVAAYFSGTGTTSYDPEGVQFRLVGTTKLEPTGPDISID